MYLKKKMGNRVHFKKVDKDDIDILFDWANEPVTRSMSFDSEPIEWETHEKWFHEHFNDKNYLILILLDEINNRIGSVRFKIKNDEAIIAITIAPEYRKMGYAVTGIQETVDFLFNENNRINRVIAMIKHENEPSLRTFLKAGFIFKKKEHEYKSFKCCYLIKNRNKV